jgi:hypothetical protein
LLSSLPAKATAVRALRLRRLPRPGRLLWIPVRPALQPVLTGEIAQRWKREGQFDKNLQAFFGLRWIAQRLKKRGQFFRSLERSTKIYKRFSLDCSTFEKAGPILQIFGTGDKNLQTFFFAALLQQCNAEVGIFDSFSDL